MAWKKELVLYNYKLRGLAILVLPVQYRLYQVVTCVHTINVHAYVGFIWVLQLSLLYYSSGTAKDGECAIQ